jgi:hypothetical protein
MTTWLPPKNLLPLAGGVPPARDYAALASNRCLEWQL